MDTLTRLLDRLPLAFFAGLAAGALAAAVVFLGVLFGWACWIITTIR
jgi:hypothetical protein